MGQGLWSAGQCGLRVRGQILVIGLLCSLSGCGHSGPQYAGAGGVVAFDEQPVPGAGVMFAPVGGGPVASATTDEQGRFELRTLNHDGALVGEHQVSVTKGHTEETTVPNAVMPMIRFISELPEKYSRRETSGLTVIVSDDDGQNDFALKLSSK